LPGKVLTSSTGGTRFRLSLAAANIKDRLPPNAFADDGDLSSAQAITHKKAAI